MATDRSCERGPSELSCASHMCMHVHVHVVKLGTFRDAQITPLWSRHVLLVAMVPYFVSPLRTLCMPLYTHTHLSPWLLSLKKL